MRKYLNIFHEEHNLECMYIDNENFDNSRALPVGTRLTILDNGKLAEAVLIYNQEKGNFALDAGDHKIEPVQGVEVLSVRDK